ncbi:cuticle protein 8-like [Plodia interpunctella]|uniref:cuticle protein 8-like n=1 Tax=Plodia interpunctella TaxID=58824 RepID=UPI002368711D|nr:cuticle protein 8-like [Plodia interpunctella]
MWFQILAACLVLACIQAHPVAVSHQARSDHHHHDHHGHGYYGHGHHGLDHHGHWDNHMHHIPSYKFSYSVSDHHTGDEKAQSEWRHGDLVKGAYSLVEPDGNVRSVHYVADHHNGFNADVHHKTLHHHIQHGHHH